MDSIVHQYRRQRCRFGRPCSFSDRQAILLVDVEPNPALLCDYLVRTPLDAASQPATQYSLHEVSTEAAVLTNRGTRHERQQDAEASGLVSRANLRESVTRMEHAIELCAKQNCFDIYGDYFDSPSTPSQVQEASTAELIQFRDPMGNRHASSLCWMTPASKLAVAFSAPGLNTFAPGGAFDSYVWDIERHEPELTLKPSSPLVDLDVSFTDANLLLAGQHNGQIAIWDDRTSPRPVDTSPIEKSHRDCVHAVKFTASSSATECFSSSTDGQVLWWDIRKLSEPTQRLQITCDNRTYGGISLGVDPSSPARFMIGTEQGCIVGGDRRLPPPDCLFATYKGHQGPVYGLERNPHCPTYFLSVGDWAARVWCENLREAPVMWTNQHDRSLTCGTWSTSRPAVAFTGREDGVVDVWDFLDRHDAPRLSIRASEAAIRCVRVNHSGYFVAAGACDGTVRIFELGEGLALARPNELSSMFNLLERETARERILVQRGGVDRRLAGDIPMQDTESPQPELSQDDAKRAFWDAVSTVVDSTAII